VAFFIIRAESLRSELRSDLREGLKRQGLQIVLECLFDEYATIDKSGQKGELQPCLR
jgi:hypothetical protein